MRPSNRLFPIAILAILLCVPAAASGQSADGFCFRARPLADCRTFLISDVGLGRRMVGTDAPDGREIDQMMDWRVAMDLGLMVNRGEREALGASAVVRIGDEIIIWGPRGRYRRWLPSGRAWEVSAAALVASSEVTDNPGSNGWASYDGLGGELGGTFILASWLAVGADLVAMPFAGGGWDVSVQPSFRITGPAGLTLALTFAAVAATKPSMSW